MFAVRRIALVWLFTIDKIGVIWILLLEPEEAAGLFAHSVWSFLNRLHFQLLEPFIQPP